MKFNASKSQIVRIEQTRSMQSMWVVFQ